jgi:hypothetical protein
MAETKQPETTEKRTRQTKTNLLATKIQANLAGKASQQITVKATLTGTAAEVWAAIQRDGEGLGLDDKAILVALLDAGGVTLRKALREIPRS